MSTALDLLTGEMERLFSGPEMKELCATYLEIDADAEGISDGSKSVFARKLVSYCAQNNSTEALVDVIFALKKGLADAGLRQFYEKSFTTEELVGGVSISGYIVKEKLSTDSIGTIYSCESEKDEETELLLHVVDAKFAVDAQAVQRYVTLMRMLRANRNPRVEEVLSTGILPDGRPYSVTKPANGTPLSERMPLWVPEALTVFEAVVDAVESVHERRIVHGNLGFGKVTLVYNDDGKQDVVIGGFGSDRLVSIPGSLLGRSPEQARNESPDIRSDIYALGALLYEMIAGKPPFEMSSPSDYKLAHLAYPVPSLSDVSEEATAAGLDGLISSLMAKDPAARPQDLDALRTRLEEAKRQVEKIEARTASIGTREDIALAIATLYEYPAADESLDQLFQAAKEHNAWAAAIEVMEEAASGIADKEQAKKVLLRAADASFRKAKDYVKALSIYEFYSEEDPYDVVARDAVFEILEAAGRYEELVEKLTAALEITQDPTQRISMLMRIARIQEKKLKQPESAYGYYVACLTGADSDKELIEPLERLAEQLGKFAELAASLGEAAAAAENAANLTLTVFLYSKLGDYYNNKLNEPAYAMTCFQKVLELEPENQEALKAIGDLYRSAQQWVELAQVCMRLGEVEPVPRKKRDYFVETAELMYEKVGNIEEAMRLLDAVLTEDPAHRSAVDLMTDILKAHGEWDRLAKLLSETLGLISDTDELLRAQCRLGELYEDQLKDAKSARTYYEKALEIKPNHLDALKGLERIYAQIGDPAAVKENLEAQLAASVTPKQKVELLSRLADISEEEFKDYGKAIEYLTQILEADDSHRYALLGLTRLYKRAERWEELVDVLERRAKSASESEKKDLLKERANIIGEKLKDKQRAIQALTEVSSLGVDDALMTLAQTQEESGDFGAAVETLKKMVDAASAPDAMQSLLVKIAGIQKEKLSDMDAAIVTLRRARDIDPTNRSVLLMLREAMISKNNFAEALSILDQEAKLEEGASSRAELFAQMGVICVDQLKDGDRSLGYFREALRLDENNFAAAYYTVRLYRQRGETEAAVPLFQKLIDAAAQLGAEQQVDLFSDIGDAYAELNRTEDAFHAYSRATDVENVEFSLELILKFGRMGLEREEYGLVRDKLLYFYNTSQEGMTDEQKIPLLTMLSRALLAQKDFADANRHLRTVLSLSPDSLEAKVLLTDVQEERGDFRPMVESLIEVASSLDEGDERRVGFLKRAGVVLFEKLRDAEAAVEQLQKALQVSPNDRPVLAELLKIYTVTKNFKELVGVILRISELEDDPLKKSAYYLSAAKVYRRELRDVDNAITYFEKVLELDPASEKAATAILETLEENHEWEKLQAHYKRQISRLTKDATAEDRLKVFEPLFNLAHTKLHNKTDAIVMAEAIVKLAPEKTEYQEKLAELYGWDTQFADKAIKLHNNMLKKNPAKADSLRQLYRIYSAQGNPDKTWCAASLLSLINQCTPEELTYYKEYRPTDLLTFANVLDSEQWKRKLLHEDMDQTITSIFSIIQNPIYQTCGQPLARYGLDPEHAIEVTHGEYPATQYINFAAGTLGIAPPPFYFVQGVSGFRALETNPPIMVSDGNEQAYMDRVATIFHLGQELTLFYPGLFVTQMIQSGTELLSWLLAAIRIFAPTLPIPNDIAGAVSDKLGPLRASLNDFEMERLQGHVHTFISKSAAEVNLKKWAKSVNFSQDRAGLLLCGDLSTAVKVVREQVKDEAQLADRLRALSVFAISEAHFDLRDHLGSALRTA